MGAADFTFGFVLAWNSGTFKLLDASEVVAVPRFSLEQEADHGGFEFSLSGLKRLGCTWVLAQGLGKQTRQSQSQSNFQFSICIGGDKFGQLQVCQTPLRLLQHLDFHDNHGITGDLSSLSGLELLSFTSVLAGCMSLEK